MNNIWNLGTFIAKELNMKIKELLSDLTLGVKVGRAVLKDVRQYTWKERAKRILTFR